MARHVDYDVVCVGPGPDSRKIFCTTYRVTNYRRVRDVAYGHPHYPHRLTMQSDFSYISTS
jgi:hypothetical protein